MGLAQLFALIVKYVVIPEVANVVRANPTITDAEILAKLPADVAALVTSDQTFLDSIRTQAGK